MRLSEPLNRSLRDDGSPALRTSQQQQMDFMRSEMSPWSRTTFRYQDRTTYRLYEIRSARLFNPEANFKEPLFGSSLYNMVYDLSSSQTLAKDLSLEEMAVGSHDLHHSLKVRGSKSEEWNLDHARKVLMAAFPRDLSWTFKNNRSPYLDRLPPEIILKVIHYLGSLHDLDTLLRSHDHCLSVFLSSEHIVMRMARGRLFTRLTTLFSRPIWRSDALRVFDVREEHDVGFPRPPMWPGAIYSPGMCICRPSARLDQNIIFDLYQTPMTPCTNQSAGVDPGFFKSIASRLTTALELGLTSYGFCDCTSVRRGELQYRPILNIPEEHHSAVPVLHQVLYTMRAFSSMPTLSPDVSAQQILQVGPLLQFLERENHERDGGSTLLCFLPFAETRCGRRIFELVAWHIREKRQLWEPNDSTERLPFPVDELMSFPFYTEERPAKMTKVMQFDQPRREG